MQPREPLLSNPTPDDEQLVLLEHVNDSAVFYPGKQHGKHLDLLLHLSRYSNLLLTITGQQGSGKTHLKNRMLQQLDSGVMVSHLEAENTISAAQLLHLLSQKLNIEVPPKADFNFYITEIRNFSSLLNEEGGSCLIIIDNAELLEQDALNIILDLATTSSDSHRPHVALFGSPELFNKLNTKENITRFETVGYHLPLEAFNEAETKAYLEHRCNSVGIHQLPLDEQQLLNIFKAARGLPGLLNLALVKELRDAPSQPRLDKSTKAPAKKIKLPSKAVAKPSKTKKAQATAKKGNMPIWPLLAVALVIALLVIGYIYKGQLSSSPSLDTSLISRSHEISQNIPLGSTTQPRKPILNLEPERPIEQPIINTPITPAEEIKPEPLSSAESSLDLPDDTPTESKPSEPPAVVEPVQKPSVPKGTWVDQGARREATLMAKPAEHFTLQMMGSLDEASVKSFIEAQSTNPEGFLYFEGRYKDQPWYVVVYGDYPDRDTALAAIKNLPAVLQKQRPWARNFLSVQNDLRDR